MGNLVIRGQEAYARDSQGGGKQEKQEKNVQNYIYFVLRKVQRPYSWDEGERRLPVVGNSESLSFYFIMIYKRSF